MADNSESKVYLTAADLSVRTGVSLSTIHRLKDRGKIPYFQPAGKGGRVLFPRDAIERARDSSQESAPPPYGHSGGFNGRLAGPRPAWMQPMTSKKPG